MYTVPPYFTRSQCKLSQSEDTDDVFTPACMMDQTKTTATKPEAPSSKPTLSTSDYKFSTYVHPAVVSTVNDSSLTPPPFHGTKQETSRDWLNYFKRYVEFKQLPEAARLALFALLLRDTANIWYNNLEESTRNSYEGTIKAFEEKYAPAPISRWKRASEFWSRDQGPNESVDEYYADMVKRARGFRDDDKDDDSDMTRYAIMRGLRPALRTYVMQQNPETTAELLEAAKIAEATVAETTTMANAEILEAISRLEQRVANSVSDPSRVRFTRSPSSARRDARQLLNNQDRPPTPRQPSPAPQRAWSSPSPAPATATPTAPQRNTTPAQQPLRGCSNCARVHQFGQCIARGKICRKCGKMNHFAVCCRSRQRTE